MAWTRDGASSRGKRVKMSEEGHPRIHRQNPKREGVIVGEGYGGTCWRVLWDGIKTPDAVHKSFITILDN